MALNVLVTLLVSFVVKPKNILMVLLSHPPVTRLMRRFSGFCQRCLRLTLTRLNRRESVAFCIAKNFRPKCEGFLFLPHMFLSKLFKFELILNVARVEAVMY